MTFPITIVDNFFEDPDAIVEIANNLKFFNPQTGNWPGTRTKNLHVEEPRFYMYFTQKLNSIFFGDNPALTSFLTISLSDIIPSQNFLSEAITIPPILFLDSTSITSDIAADGGSVITPGIAFTCRTCCMSITNSQHLQCMYSSVHLNP